MDVGAVNIRDVYKNIRDGKRIKELRAGSEETRKQRTLKMGNDRNEKQSSVVADTAERKGAQNRAVPKWSDVRRTQEPKRHAPPTYMRSKC